MVRITKNPTTGLVFTKNEGLGKDGKQYGYIRLAETKIDMSQGVAKVKEISALKTFSEADYNKARHILVDGFEQPGRIRTIESLSQEKGMKAKVAYTDGPACLLDGQQIYFKTEFVSATSELNDELIAHNNVIVGSSVVKAEGNALNA